MWSGFMKNIMKFVKNNIGKVVAVFAAVVVVGAAGTVLILSNQPKASEPTAQADTTEQNVENNNTAAEPAEPAALSADNNTDETPSADVPGTTQKATTSSKKANVTTAGAHEHNWEMIYREEQVLDQEEWTEFVYEHKPWMMCNTCGQKLYSAEEFDEHQSSLNHHGFCDGADDILTNTIIHPAIYKSIKVPVEYKCTVCGETRKLKMEEQDN